MLSTSSQIPGLPAQGQRNHTYSIPPLWWMRIKCAMYRRLSSKFLQIGILSNAAALGSFLAQWVNHSQLHWLTAFGRIYHPSCKEGAYHQRLHLHWRRDNHCNWWQHTKIIWDDRIWRSYLIIIYGVHRQISYMIIIYDDLLWWSYLIMIHGHHIWLASMIIENVHHIWSSN